MMQRLIAAAAVAALVLTVTSGCGDDGGAGRPSVDEIAVGVQHSVGDALDDAPQSVIDCLAQAFHDSDVSDKTLQAIATGDDKYEPSDGDARALRSVTAKELPTCVSGAAK